MQGYTFRVFFSEEDGEWVAVSDDELFLSWLAPTPQEALDGLIKVLEADDA